MANRKVTVIGGGILGLSVGIALRTSFKKIEVTIYEKELTLGIHASSRNSGVIHAGFYYSPDSLKARYCANGNKELKELCRKYSLPIQEIGKVVVASNFDELERLQHLYKRGLENNIDLVLLDESKLKTFEPAAQTFGQFLWSPTTAVADPFAILEQLTKNFIDLGGKIVTGKEVALRQIGNEIVASIEGNDLPTAQIVNAAGAYSAQLAQNVGVGLEYKCLPFLGSYKVSSRNARSPKVLIYPVPHPINPFLGAHVTLKLNGDIKIGPTAFPVIGREQYSLSSRFTFSEANSLFQSIASLTRGREYNSFEIIRTEFPKLFTKSLVKDIEKLVPSIDQGQHWKKLQPGIRAQLVNIESGKLEQDFVVRQKENSIHVLNAVSPGWTSALPFGRSIAESIAT
jgi:L-2-hydroxyglutarate oxidase